VPRTSLIFRHRIPRPPLDAFVASLWVCESAPRPLALERVLPTGAAQLILNLKEDETRLYDHEHPDRCVSTSGTILTGIQSRYQIIDTAEQELVAGVAFKPGGTVPFLRVPADALIDVDVPLDALDGCRGAASLRERVLDARTPDAQLDAIEAALRDLWVRRAASPHPAVVFALASFDRVPRLASIGTVTDAIGLSAKRFIERFTREVGVTPKRYCRIRRFQRAVTLAHRSRDIAWASVALDCGYFDQAHFIHDFRAFAGLTPTAYQAGRTVFQNHVKFLQSGANDA
jgi:AraC-like DNA-binding protein